MNLSHIQTPSGENIKVQLGISEKQIEKLVELTNSDPEIKKFTSDLERFPNKESFDKWVKDKYVYTLVGENNKLLGLIWFEIKSIPLQGLTDYGITIAIRTYGEARGKGYFQQFLNKAINHFKKTKEFQKIKSKGMWVSSAKDNIPSQKAFEKFGFKTVEDRTIPTRVFMVLNKRFTS